jgi:redox-sensitive bicupin YhaK (pirin superfamily)
MIELISSESRGSADHGWLKARHTFSFAEYQNPKRVRFGPLRVINEDRIAPGKGFGTHPHKDMEIVTYPISGAIEHSDSMGNGTVISAGEVQRMTAGSGVQHSEFNHSQTDELHLLQIWLFPEENDLEPGYEQEMFSREDKLDQLRLIASRDGRDGSVTVHQKVDLYASILQPNTEMEHIIADSHKVFVQIVSGVVTINGQSASAGDGVQISGENKLIISGDEEAEFLMFDMG